MHDLCLDENVAFAAEPTHVKVLARARRNGRLEKRMVFGAFLEAR